jgi:hypothetical protein
MAEDGLRRRFATDSMNGASRVEGAREHLVSDRLAQAMAVNRQSTI